MLITAAKPMIDTLINKVVKPKIEQFVETCSIKYNELLIPRGEHFEEYLYRTYKKYSFINTLVLKNERRVLKELYVPLTLKKKERRNNIEIEIKIDKYPSELIRECNKILITDTAGMGKSTLTKLLFLDVIENGYGIPIYIEMRRLNKGRTILHEIQEQINSLSKEFNPKLLLEFIQTGGFVFFLDGYDEISLEERSIVTTNVQDFISKAGNNVFFLTSRPEQILTCFGDFQMFSINPLNKKESYELLRKYDKQGSTSKSLIDELKTGQYEMINEFLKNPLLVSLLYAAFDYKHTIPLKKHIFYRQVYDAYFDSHDLSKGDGYIHEKCSNLDVDDFERILRFVGFKCLKYQKIEFEKDTLLKIIDEAKEFCSNLKFSSSDFIEDILTAVPLFCIDGHLYKWVHKSLQEYFAAQFIFKDSKKDQDAILSALYSSSNFDKYINLLDLYYDIDNWGFKKNILLPLCESYAKYYEENIFISDILEEEDIECRIGTLFMYDASIVKLEYENNERSFKLPFFEKAKKQVENYFRKEVSSLLAINSKYCNCLFYINGDKRKLFPVLEKRLSNLFKLVKSNSRDFDFNYETNEVKYIDIHTGEKNKEIYKNITSFISDGPNEKPYYFCYSECKKEIKQILNIIKRKENTSNLIEGL